MSEQDKYEAQAVSIVASVFGDDRLDDDTTLDNLVDALSAALRAQGLEIERLNGLILTRSVEWGRAMHELAQLKAQIAATRRINEQLMAGNDKLEAQLGEAETFRRSITCRNCSNQTWLFLPNDWGESWSEDRGLHEYYCPDHNRIQPG